MYTPLEQVERGCGTREEAGVYAELPLSMSPNAKPVEHFLIDPPIPVQDLNINPLGVTLIERFDHWHVLDWVGESPYPNPTDDIEEIRRFGMSARLELSPEQYALLEPDVSKVLRVHKYAGLEPFADNIRFGFKAPPLLELQLQELWFAYSWNTCPKGIPEHEADPLHLCVGWCWLNVSPLKQPPLLTEPGNVGLREMPAFNYFAANVPTNSFLSYPAIYAAFPIHQIAVINDPLGGRHEDKVKKLENCKIPFAVVDG